MTQVEQLREWRDAAYEARNFTTAELLADKILTLTRDAADAYWLAQIYASQGNNLRGADVLVRNEHVSDLKCRTVASRCLLAANRPEEALALLGELPEPTSSKIRPEDRIDWAYLSFLEGEIHAHGNNFDGAKAAYQRAVFTDVACFEAFNKLVSHKLLTVDEEASLLKRLQFSQFDESADLIRSLYATRITPVGPTAQSTKESLQALKDEFALGTNSDVLTLECRTLYNESRFPACRELCERVLEADPYNYAVYPSYVAALHELGETNKLYRISHNLAETSPDAAVAWHTIGVYYMSVGNLGEARRQFSKASLMDPYFSEAWMGFAHTFAQEGEHEQAITAYSTAARLFPGSHQPAMFLGMQHLHLNNLTLAEEYLMTANRIYGNDPLLLNEIGVVFYHKNELARSKGYLERALEVVEEIGSDVKTAASIKANLGHVHRRMGHAAQSLEYFEQVAWESEPSVSVLVTMGMVYLQLGDVDSAIERLTAALSMNRNDPIASDILRRALAKSLVHQPLSKLAREDIEIDVQRVTAE